MNPSFSLSDSFYSRFNLSTQTYNHIVLLTRRNKQPEVASIVKTQAGFVKNNASVKNCNQVLCLGYLYIIRIILFAATTIFISIK